jgi:hypothetical protein
MIKFRKGRLSNMPHVKDVFGYHYKIYTSPDLFIEEDESIVIPTFFFKKYLI